METRDSADQGVETLLTTPSGTIRGQLSINPIDGGKAAPSAMKIQKSKWNGEEYLRGPIPWLWLRSTYHISPSCTLVALGLWHWRALRKATTFQLSMRRLAKFLGLSHKTVQRRVEDMNAAGMIEVKRQAGASHTFTINEKLASSEG